MRRVLLASLLLPLLATLAWAATRRDAAPAVLVKDARVWGHPDSDSLVLRDGKVAALGKGMKAPAGALVLDAHHAWVLPGFHDAHVHMLGGGFSLVRVQLNGETTLAGTLAAIQAWAAAHPERPWVQGRGFTYDVVPTGQFPTRQMLDSVVKDRPVYVRAYDGHSGWANSLAIQRAGITKDTPDPADGKITREADGSPAGMFLEGAQELFEKAVPQPTRAEYKQALKAAADACAALGITSVMDIEDEEVLFELWRELDTEGRLPLYVSMGYPIDGPLDRFEKMRALPPTPHVRFGLLKAFIDGVFDSGTAYTLTPYPGSKDNVGRPMMEPAHYKELVARAHAKGFQVATHAIGDAGVRLALDAYEGARKQHPEIRTRHRVEHIEVVDPADVPRFAKLDVLASMQPYHVVPNEPDPDKGAWAENVGPERAKMAMAWRALLDAGAPLSFGSDWPVYTQNPLHGLAMALLRETPRGIPAGGWMPQHKLNLAQAVNAYTVERGLPAGPAKDVGRLDVGQRADLVVLTPNADLEQPRTLWEAGVAATVVDGRVVFSR